VAHFQTRRLDVDARFDLLKLHSYNPERYPHLLQSTAAGPQGLHDILFGFPGETLTLERDATFDFLGALDAWWRSEAVARPDGEVPPFTGGWFLYLGYELAAQIEPTLRLPVWHDDQPTAFAVRIPAAVVRNTRDGTVTLVAESSDYLDRMQRDVRAASDVTVRDDGVGIERLEQEPDERYLQAVRRIHEYIRDGDVFQVNLSRQWRCRLTGDVADAHLYARLRDSNPGPFNGLATWNDTGIVSSSPERLVSIRGDRVDTRPIAGTRPRGKGTEMDQVLSAELLAHPKERAEHVMLIDLERNDLGRIAVPGSVRVDELMTLESYATVHHIVSNVQARRRPDVSPADVIRAVFPGGTITGCPKVRCMEIIAELENAGRGPYTGSIGYLDRTGDLDLNILIRSIVRTGDRLTFRAGAGIVFDSDPAGELAETRAKARGMLRALGVETP
jgi:anthranilate synthase component 1